MKNRFMAFAALAILCGIGPTVSADDDAAVTRFTRALAAVDIPTAHVSVVAQPLEAGKLSGGKTWSLNPNALRLTASTAKLYTTYAALVRLGPATTLKTDVWQSDNDLVIVGSGDPSMTVERLSSLLRQLRAQGIKAIRGNIVLDRSRFGTASALAFDPMAFDAKPMRPYNVGPDALLLNFRAIQVVLTPQNDHVLARLETPLAGAEIDNQLQPGDGPCSDWKDNIQSSISGNFRITLKGKLPRSCTPQTLQLAAHGPELAGETGANKYAEALIRGLWLEMGGSWSGKAVSGTKPASATLIALSATMIAWSARTLLWAAAAALVAAFALLVAAALAAFSAAVTFSLVQAVTSEASPVEVPGKKSLRSARSCNCWVIMVSLSKQSSVVLAGNLPPSG